jgi:hypothetical protein
MRTDVGAITRTAFVSSLLAVSVTACSAGNSISPVPSSSEASLMRSDTAASVRLADARWYAVLAGAGVMSSGKSQITGRVGIFPGTAITGFPPGVIRGTLHAGDPAAKRAEMSLTTAYDAAVSQANDAITVSGNLGGQRLAPGLYKSTSSLAVSSGDVTLDGGGNAHAVWVFQMASSFTMTTGRKIVLTNGANARNVYWAVGSSATLGTGCVFRGDLLVAESISIGTGTNIVGRALAKAGAVTLESTTIVRPTL